MPEWLKKILGDVPSRIVAGLLIGLITWLAGQAVAPASIEWLTPELAAELLGVLALMLAFTSVSNWWKRRPLRAGVDLELDGTFYHAPVVVVSVQNLRSRKTFLRRVELVNKEQWDIPDPYCEAFPSPVVAHLPDFPPRVSIGATKGSATSHAINTVVGRGESLEVRFRLITDHAPNFGVGIFAFHVGMTLVYGDPEERLPLRDIVVSLHAMTSMGLHRGTDPAWVYPVPDRKSLANTVLSKIGPDVRCPPPIYEMLKQLARVA